MKNSKLTKIFIGITLIAMLLVILFVTFNNKTDNNVDSPMYSDTTIETFDVNFLTENDLKDKEGYTKTKEEYIAFIKTTNDLFNSAISQLNLSETTDSELGITGAIYSNFKTNFTDYNENVIKAELYKRGYIVKNGIITETDTLASALHTYFDTTSFNTITKDVLKTHGVKVEEIERYFTVKKTTDNMIIVGNLKYNSGEKGLVDLSPKVIYVFGKTDGKLMLYGEYPLRKDVFDMSFLIPTFNSNSSIDN